MYFVTDKKSLKQSFTLLKKLGNPVKNPYSHVSEFYFGIEKDRVTICSINPYYDNPLIALFTLPCSRIDFEDYKNRQLTISVEDTAFMLMTINSTPDDSKVTIDISNIASDKPKVSYITKQGTINFKSDVIDDVVLDLEFSDISYDKYITVDLAKENLNLKDIAKKISFIPKPTVRTDILNNVKFTIKGSKLSIFASDAYSVAKFDYKLKHTNSANTYTALIDLTLFKRLASSPDMFNELVFYIKDNSCNYFKIRNHNKDNFIMFPRSKNTNYPDIKLPITKNHKLANNAELDYEHMLDLIGTINSYKEYVRTGKAAIELVFKPMEQVLTVNSDPNNKENGYFRTDIPCKIDTKTGEEFTIGFNPTKLYKAMSKIKGKGYETATYYLSCTHKLSPLVIENTVDQGYQQYIAPMRINTEENKYE